MQEFPCPSAILIPQYLPHLRKIQPHELPEAFHFTQDVSEIIARHTRYRAQHLDGRWVLHRWLEARLGRPLEDGGDLVRFRVVQFQVGDDLDRFMRRRGPYDAYPGEVQGEEYELRLEVEVVSPVVQVRVSPGILPPRVFACLCGSAIE